MIKRLLYFFGMFIVASNSFGQDVHFSQFYASPLSLNPANTGNYHGDWRVMNNYRRQWKSITTPFVSASLAYDQQFYVKNHNFSGGIILISDKSGDSKLTVNEILLSGAYHKTINGNNLHFGLQGGIVNKSFDMSQVTFPDQYDIVTGDFNSQMTTVGTPAGTQITYFDLNLGFAWSKKFGNFEPQIGAALFHANKPKETFYNLNSHQEFRKVFSLGGKLALSSKVFIQPNVLYMVQTKASDLLMGMNLGINIKNNPIKLKSLFGGVLGRNGFATSSSDAMVIITGLNFNKLTLGVSYDISMSQLKAKEISNRRGAVEFSLIYTGLSTLIDKISIPCERY